MFWVSTQGLAFAAFSLDIFSVEPVNIYSTQQLVTVKLNISNLPSPSYFRVALQKAAGGNYFGQIKNQSGQWVDVLSLSSDCKNYYYFDASGSGQLDITLRIGENSNVQDGAYHLIAHRFTSTACSATKSQNEFTINFVLPSPTSFPTETSKPTPSQIPKPTTKPTSTLIPKSPTPEPTKIPSIVVRQQVRTEPSNTPLVKQVLSSSTSQIPDSPTLSEIKTQPVTPTPNRFPFTLIMTGVLILGIAFYIHA